MSKKPPRLPTLKVKALSSKKKRTASSRQWLLRQLNDPYVHAAEKKGYRSRAAFKLIELNEKYHFLKSGQTVVDLGAAPGGWTQVCVEQVGKTGTVVALDLREIDPISGVDMICGDFTEEGILDLLREKLPHKVDAVLSDMAAPACGIPSVDHLRIMGLLEMVFDFCKDFLKPGGAMVAKVLRGGTEHTLLAELKKRFEKVVHMKPNASRHESAEMYIVCIGFR